MSPKAALSAVVHHATHPCRKDAPMQRPALGHISNSLRRCRGIVAIVGALAAWGTTAFAQGVLTIDPNSTPSSVTANATLDRSERAAGEPISCGVGNCPRTPGFWSQQCAQRPN